VDLDGDPWTRSVSTEALTNTNFLDDAPVSEPPSGLHRIDKTKVLRKAKPRNSENYKGHFVSGLEIPGAQ
jgi:hypothetical protein